ncbi:Uma2 family endonuclease [Dolichospermum sp. ST_sed1]|nr:Uma2 family endonuclease [Dolichospermum sp. ST_sed1]MDD1423380.1 Uma2 family endonuclease [Dolichospermum sp. ST_sed9]MDD1434000.1 Uma2 family endonuclease [Dolichospermum sp. ST_sed6]MDD1439364.1 Uma2 family endonuclease [Dolichospermum sp. ST_sed3]MDD1445188.1 Uma2 family endonuclease [Dolichospermum sp. ST_sed8]MDD1457552.1 Uma2 family endonuclease [Dolichospermum sp. ST_sed7]MDD1462468.1 Uma2 family endonuclease [Dolichospermum sp. ST_sed2]MDD1466943.1 Uma2 family endonuclease [Dolic
MVITQTSPPSITQDITTTHFTPEEYRVIEETAAEKHEYHNGEIIAMAGGSEVHSRLTVNITTLLNVALRDTNFQTYNGDLRIWISEFNHGTYADVLVINGEPEFNGERTDEIVNPLVIVEVLSPSTEGYDRGEKFRKYRSLPSFCEYLLVSQTEPYIEQYHKLNDSSDSEAMLQAVRWQWQVYDHLDQSILVHSLNIEVPLGEVYRRINF